MTVWNLYRYGFKLIVWIWPLRSLQGRVRFVSTPKVQTSDFLFIFKWFAHFHLWKIYQIRSAQDQLSRYLLCSRSVAWVNLAQVAPHGWNPLDSSFWDNFGHFCHLGIPHISHLTQNHPNQTANESTLIFISIVLYRLTR